MFHLFATSHGLARTSAGLDSLAALKIAQVLYSFATDSGMAVICTV